MKVAILCGGPGTRLREETGFRPKPLVVTERALAEYEAETVFHLAAQTIVGIANRNPVSTFESNTQGTWNVLESCRRLPGYIGIYRFVAVSVLTPFGFRDADAIACILIAQVLQYVMTGLWGSFGLWRYPRVRDKT